MLLPKPYISVSGTEPFDINTTNLNLVSREMLIKWLKWNDRNGIYLDDESIAEGMNPLTKKEAIELIALTSEAGSPSSMFSVNP